jgi:conjugal transfer ATP-binding protein TraC
MLSRLFRTPQASLTEILPYWEIKNGIVYLYSGQAEVGLELRLPATTLAPDGELLRLHHALMSALHHAVPEGERLRLYVEVAPLRRRLLDAYARNRCNGRSVRHRPAPRSPYICG